MNRLSIILILSSILLSSCGAGKPKGGEGISYFGAAWLNNERIVYTKQVETVKFSYNPLAKLGNNTSQLVRTDYFICTMDLEGKDEKELKQFVITDPVSGSNIRKIYLIDRDRKIYFDDEMIPWSYSCNDALIVFATKHAPGGGFYGPIYTMKPNGSELKQIVEIGTNPRLSPDGKLILYDDAKSLWLVNTDGTGKRKLVEHGSEGIWDPTGRKILYNEGPREYDCHLIKLNANYNVLSNKKFEWGGHTEDWSSDGKYVLAAGTRDTETWNEFKLTKLAAIPNYPRLSPDGKKIVGENVGLDADICIVDIDSTDREKAIKVLKKTHFKKWDNQTRTEE